MDMDMVSWNIFFNILEHNLQPFFAPGSVTQRWVGEFGVRAQLFLETTGQRANGPVWA